MYIWPGLIESTALTGTSTSDSDHLGQDTPWRFGIRQPNRFPLFDRIQRHPFIAPEYPGLSRHRRSYCHMVPGTEGSPHHNQRRVLA